MKKQLTDIIFGDTTYRQVRDAFKSIGFSGFSLSNLAVNLYVDQIKKEYEEYDYNIPNKRDIFSSLHRQMNGIEYPYEPNLMYYVDKAKPVLDTLLKEKLIKKDDAYDYYSLTSDGHSLRMQKALNRIPFKRAEALMVKMLNSVKAFNSNPDSPYRITEIYVYGSTQRQEKDVGDIDIAFSYAKNIQPNEDIVGYSDRMIKTYEISRYEYLIGKLAGMAYKSLNVSPYISSSDTMDLEELMEQGAKGSLLFIEDGIKPSIDVPKYEFKTLRKEAGLTLVR